MKIVRPSEIIGLNAPRPIEKTLRPVRTPRPVVGQMLGHIASVVRSSDPPAAVDAIGMSELKARLMRRYKL